MLSSQLNLTFIIGIVIVYGLNLGFAGSFFSGYRRRPYFVVAGILGCASALLVVLIGNLPAALALICLTGAAEGMAIADVTIDACIARKSIEVRSLAPDMQSLCFLSRCWGFVIYEMRSSSLHSEKQKTMENLGVAIRGMYQTIKFPQVWKPSLYMYLSLALSISTHEGQILLEFVGIIYAIALIRHIRNAQSDLHSSMELSAWSSRLLLCYHGRMHIFTLTSKWGGGIALHVFHVTRTDFTNLWLVVLIRNILRFVTLDLIFLVPKADQSDALIPPDILTKNSTVKSDDEGLELVPKNERDEV
ncbi:Detected protein of unknown function [Hibiscus syriacus]|uniref:Uncharacterized protein n=1 Tax=Hibiscus syriacus TaxID=106335 RepID=A0A6A3CTE7_HIBSY|nr:Detected protein of unknown function [Hibiscus syriacus]